MSIRGLCLLLVGAAVTADAGHTGAAGHPAPSAIAFDDRAAKESAGGVRLVRVGSFRLPVHVTGPPGDPSRVMVVERDGRIRVVKDGKVQRRPFLDIRRRVRSSHEQGLLSMAFAPDYAESGLFYVYFTDRAGDQRVVEFRRRGPDQADVAIRSARVADARRPPVPQRRAARLRSGRDALHRHGRRWRGRRPARRARERPRPWVAARQDPAHRSPGATASRVLDSVGNPFRTRRGARDEIYAYGLRNPWRFSFDRKTGDLAIGDVGQDRWEEINFVPRGRGRGANFGWRPFEGRARFAPGETAPAHVEPVIAHVAPARQLRCRRRLRGPRPHRAAPRALRLRRPLPTTGVLGEADRQRGTPTATDLAASHRAHLVRRGRARSRVHGIPVRISAPNCRQRLTLGPCDARHTPTAT